MEFRLFGQVTVHAGDRVIGAAARPQQSVVLAALLVDASRLVTVEVLRHRVWGADAPAHARRTIQTHVTRIRRLLAQADPRHGSALLQYHSGGYLLRIDPKQVDVHRFRQLAAQTRDPDQDDHRRAARLREALSLWRGEPLAGLSGAWVDRVRYGWTQRWLNVLLEWAATELRLDNTTTVIDSLSEVLAEHPLEEPLIGALMRANYAAGRPAEAVSCYVGFRQRLVECLGADPGPDLQDLYRSVLRGQVVGPAREAVTVR